MKRYEKLDIGEKSVIYDRLRKELNTIDDNMDDEIFNEEISFQIAVYPNKLLKGFKNFKNCYFVFLFNIFFFLLSVFITIVVINNLNAAELYNVICYLIYLPVVIFLTIIIHEFSHALVGAHLGGVIAEIGFNRKKFIFQTKLYWVRKGIIRICLYYMSGVLANTVIVVFFGIIFLYSHSIISLLIMLYNILAFMVDAIPFKGVNNDGFLVLQTLKNREKFNENDI